MFDLSRIISLDGTQTIIGILEFLFYVTLFLCLRERQSAY